MDGAVDEFEDRYGHPATTEHENTFHEADVDSDNRLTVSEIYEKWVLPPQDTSRPWRPEDDKRPKQLQEQRKRTVAVYLPGQWTSYRVTPSEYVVPVRRGKKRTKG